MSTEDEAVSQVPDQLMEQLLKGYDSLYTEFKVLNDQTRELEHKLAWAKQQYSDVLKRFSPDAASNEIKIFQGELEEAGACEQNGQIDWLECMYHGDADRQTRAFNIRIANDAREKLRSRLQDVQGVKIWRTAGKRGSIPSKVRNDLERDYTTPGTPSRLGCPFAIALGENNPRQPLTLGQQNLPTPRSSPSRTSGSWAKNRRRKSLPFSFDPIQAEICGNDPASPEVSGQGSSAVCPIRFLDQHSPEEVAQYFEKHKHEIPRSHEVCIKRYQSNSAQIRQLDAKYGNLVSMIQGLGQKHKPWLPEKVEDEEDAENPNKESVKKWANDVSASVQDTHVEHEKPEEEDHRTSHFDRPLKEVRVGESPSRPWGISVPSKYQKAASISSDGSDNTASPQELSAPKSEMNNLDRTTPKKKTRVGKCPIDHSKLPPQNSTTNLDLHTQNASAVASAASAAAEPPPKAAQAAFVQPPLESQASAKQAAHSQNPSQMVFTGPVFIGYPVEQAAQLLRESGLGSKS